jgi:thiamine kinase-like enzyme
VTSDRLEAALAQLSWLGEVRSVSELPGGLTNHNHRVRSDGHDVVIRISSADSRLLGVDREHEWANSRTAAASGVGAPVVDYLPGQGVLVVGFLPGRTYAAGDVAVNLPRIVDAVRRLHTGPAFANRFDILARQRGYAAIVRERDLAVPEGYWAHGARMAEVEVALRRHPEVLVPCHNDLLAANFLDDDGSLRIIDYEYSGMNEPAFELGNLINESQLDHDHLVELLGLYYGRVTHHQLARAELWGLAGRYAWTLWGAISHGVSDVEHDFWDFTLERHALASELLSSPRLDALIEHASISPVASTEWP